MSVARREQPVARREQLSFHMAEEFASPYFSSPKKISLSLFPLTQAPFPFGTAIAAPPPSSLFLRQSLPGLARVKMDPWAELRQILEQPLPEKSILMRTLSWTKIRPPITISPSFDMFGEIQFREKPPLPPPLPSSAPSKTAMSWMEEDEGARQGNDGDLQAGNADCAEGIGSGILQDVEADDKCFNGQRRKNNKAMGTEHSSVQSDRRTFVRSNSDVGSSTSIEAFPPPISTIGRGVKPWVYLKSFKKDGRFVLKKIKVPTQQCLQATRENGKLMLHFAHEVDVAKIEDIGNVVGDAEENREEVDSGKRIRDQ